jgi:hypothetical protein
MVDTPTPEQLEPTHLERDVVLRDGRTVHLRPAHRDDRALVEDYLIGMSDETRRLRFWTTSIDVTDVASKAVDAAYPDHLTLLALTGSDRGQVVGGAQFIKDPAWGRSWSEVWWRPRTTRGSRSSKPRCCRRTTG